MNQINRYKHTSISVMREIKKHAFGFISEILNRSERSEPGFKKYMHNPLFLCCYQTTSKYANGQNLSLDERIFFIAAPRECHFILSPSYHVIE